MGEFDLIARCFARRASEQKAPALRLGIGDDAALLVPATGHELAISTDMLVEGRHFFADVDPRALGHKALAVNLSDMAAMGARPLGFSLALALPAPDETWLNAFADGMFALAESHSCALIGGDTTKGPLNICITVFGEVPAGKALRRSGAQPGDDVYVSGTLGDARLALAARLGEPWAREPHDSLGNAEKAFLQSRLEWPSPRVIVGLGLKGMATAAMDLSDGLGGDLAHLLRASGVGADIRVDALPCSPTLAHLPMPHRRQCQVDGGDDYELLFTAPATHRAQIAELARETQVALTRIGTSTPNACELRWLDTAGQVLDLHGRSFDHFATTR